MRIGLDETRFDTEAPGSRALRRLTGRAEGCKGAERVAVQLEEPKGKPANADNTAFAGFDYIPLCGKPEQRYYFWSIKTLIKFFVYREKSALYLRF